MNIETHSHTYHSFDSLSRIQDIISACINLNINAIVVNDHDIYNLTIEEEKLFIDNKIIVLKAIEFTTSEGIHIIGISDEIKKIEKKPYYYTSIELIEELKIIKSWIIIPHPFHGTGVIGNPNSTTTIHQKVLSNAHFIEGMNYRYGNSMVRTKELVELYDNLKIIIGSDAHKAKEIGAHYNKIINFDEKRDLLTQLYENKLDLICNMKRSKIYFFRKKIKKTKVYQAIISILSPELRLKIKRKLKLI